MTEILAGQEPESARDGCAGKTCPERLPRTTEKTSKRSSRKSSESQNQKPPLFLYLKKDGQQQGASWESMESGRWPIERWMPNIGPAPLNGESASTLSQILQEIVPQKYYLSAAACLGILRRADKRGKPIIPILRYALERQAAIMAGGQLGTAYSLLIRSGCEGGGKGALVQTEKSATLSTRNTQTLFDPAGPLVLDNHPQDSRIAIREDGMVPTLTEKMGTGGNNVPMAIRQNQVGEIRTGAVANTPNTNSNAPEQNSPLVAEPIPINDKATRHHGGGDTRHGDGAGNGLGIGSPGDPAPTLTAADRHGVAYGISRSFMNQGKNAQFNPEIILETASTLTASNCPPGVAMPLTVPEISGTLAAKMAKGTGGPAGDEMQNLVAEWPEYIIRRFTPMECCRLQGFPDWWAEQLGVEQPPPGMVDRWVKIFKTYWEVITVADGVKAPKTRSQIIKWLKDPASDSALYKMWGNGIALPCAVFVMEGIAIQNRKE